MATRTVHTIISTDLCSEVHRTEKQVLVNGRWETVTLVEEEISTPIWRHNQPTTTEFIRARKIEYDDIPPTEKVHFIPWAYDGEN